jgi:predicted dehydrogenase
MRKLKLGIIGTGLATHGLYWPQLKRLKSKIEIVAVANRRVAKARAFARLAGVKNVCEDGEALLARPDIEAVMLSLPIHLNASWVLKALKAGKHVLCEKPIAANTAEARRLIQAASRYKKLWMVGENYFFMPHIALARQWVASGRLGQIRLVEAAQVTLTLHSNKYFKTSWRQKPRHVGGFVVDAGIHIGDVLREICGMPVEVKNFSAQFDPALIPIDSAVAAMKFKSGALGIWRSCFSAKLNSEIPMLRAYGSKGTLEIYRERLVFIPLNGRETRLSSKHDGFYEQFTHFAEAVTQGKKLKFTPPQALQDLELMEMIVK